MTRTEEPKMIAQRLHGVPGYDAFKYQLCFRSPLREIKKGHE